MIANQKEHTVRRLPPTPPTPLMALAVKRRRTDSPQELSGEQAALLEQGRQIIDRLTLTGLSRSTVFELLAQSGPAPPRSRLLALPSELLQRVLLCCGVPDLGRLAAGVKAFRSPRIQGEQPIIQSAMDPARGLIFRMPPALLDETHLQQLDACEQRSTRLLDFTRWLQVRPLSPAAFSLDRHACG